MAEHPPSENDPRRDPASESREDSSRSKAHEHPMGQPARVFDPTRLNRPADAGENARGADGNGPQSGGGTQDGSTQDSGAEPGGSDPSNPAEAGRTSDEAPTPSASGAGTPPPPPPPKKRRLPFGRGGSKKPSPPPAAEMSFIDHLEELRWHIIRAGLVVLVFMIAAFLCKRLVFDYLIFAPKHPDFLSYRALCAAAEALSLGARFCLTPPEFEIANLRMLGEFLAHLRVSFVLGLVLAFPYMLYEAWRFIRPGLYQKEIRTTRGIVAWCSLLFAAGVSFGYFIIIPFSINFLVPYSISEAVSDYIQLDDYIGFITMIVLAAGVMFELPVVIYFLAKLGIVGPEFLKAHRRHAVVLILLASAIITPPDVTSQILIGLPVMLLYEVGIVIARRVSRQREAELRGRA